MHWLPVKSRIEYKILMLVYKGLHGEGPMYLASLLKQYCPARQLRSSDKLLLKEPKTKRVYGDRAFSVAGPKLWNNLDITVRQKRKRECFQRGAQDLFIQRELWFKMRTVYHLCYFYFWSITVWDKNQYTSFISIYCIDDFYSRFCVYVSFFFLIYFCFYPVYTFIYTMVVKHLEM